MAMAWGADDPYVYAKDSRYTSQADWSAGMTSAKILYPLASPVMTVIGSVSPSDLPSGRAFAWAAYGAEVRFQYQRDSTTIAERVDDNEYARGVWTMLRRYAVRDYDLSVANSPVKIPLISCYGNDEIVHPKGL